MNTASILSTALVNNATKAIDSNDFGFKLDIQLRQCVAGEKFTESGQ
jgi:hypothetical protein